MNRISIVTPTLGRPAELDGLLSNLCELETPLHELIVIDAGPPADLRTQEVVSRRRADLPFPVNYFTHARGTAIQRNAGIDRATGDFIAFVDDDVRLSPRFFRVLLAELARDVDRRVGAIVGYRTNQRTNPTGMSRWRMYRALRLFTTFEPGRYDYETGYPINNLLQPPFSGTREVDFMTTSHALWRREVFDQGLRFDPFFRDYGVLEDAHLALSAKQRNWKLLQSGDAHCEHLQSPNARTASRKLGVKSVINYYYVFQSVAGPLRMSQKLRFWRFQAFDVMRMTASSLRRRRVDDLSFILGKLEGVAMIARGQLR
ncbi:MAG TPA: glycosyltransferase family 2 protein [Kofleriaceae bacterium]|jgi:glycosyltransferase involved in cell wall biosynthesis